jgi:hypothetical protein
MELTCSPIRAKPAAVLIVKNGGPEIDLIREQKPGRHDAYHAKRAVAHPHDAIDDLRIAAKLTAPEAITHDRLVRITTGSILVGENARPSIGLTPRTENVAGVTHDIRIGFAGPLPSKSVLNGI